MARIAIIGGSADEKIRDELVEKITRELVARKHQVFHGGLDFGVMLACHKGGGIGITHQDQIDGGFALADAMNVSVLKHQFPGFNEIDFGRAIRHQLLTQECDLVIAFGGGIRTFDELIGAIMTKRKIVLVGHDWSPLLYVLFGKIEIEHEKTLLCKVLPHHPIETIVSAIEAHLKK